MNQLLMVSKGKNIKYSHTYNEEFSSANLFLEQAEKVIVVVKILIDILTY